MPAAQPKYDRVTLVLHAALAVGVVAQLLLSIVMTVPPGTGLGVRDWHREAFEIHSRIGLGVAAACGLHWLWICLPGARPKMSSLFPWIRADGRSLLKKGFRNLMQLRLLDADERSTFVATVHGLGLAAVTGSASGGIINYLGYFVGAPIPDLVLHWVARCHIALGYLVAAFVIGHGSMAVRHWLSPRPSHP